MDKRRRKNYETVRQTNIVTIRKKNIQKNVQTQKYIDKICNCNTIIILDKEDDFQGKKCNSKRWARN